MATSIIYLIVTILLVAADTAFAESNMLQDFCVADLKGEKVNGYRCKDPAQVTPEDFYCLANAASTTNTTLGSAVTSANVEKIPGLNTLGVSMSRVDYAPGGLNPPHLHPRASEAIFVLEGRLFVGFLTTTGKLIYKHVNKGSQNPGAQGVGLSLFGANPPIPDDLLAKAFYLEPQEIQKVKGKFPIKK
uniref:Cupin type-1 domain-containing protein n=1 Tax=Brassica campestris TaxID=3711 RepID=M4ERK4_BRACM